MVTLSFDSVQDVPLLTTKLYVPPPRPNLVPRPRLIKRLNEGLHRKLTLVSAPAGFGKTTLVSEWASHFGLPIFDSLTTLRAGFGLTSSGDPTRKTAQSKIQNQKSPIAVTWLSLDKSDNDPVRFFTYLIAALQTLYPNLGQAVQSLLGSPQLPPLEALVAMLINDITAMPTPFVLVLDDYHTIVELIIHEAMGFLLERQPPQMHMVFVTRQDPLLPLSRLRAHGHMTELRASDLQFTSEEAAAFLNQRMRLNTLSCV